MESECKQTCMDFDIKQTRRFYLAGTVAFPTPFPSAGGISIENGSLLLSDGRQRVTFVVVQEQTEVEEATIRVVRNSDVAAIFFPGVWVDTDKGRMFRFTKRDGVHDLEEGEWFLGPDIEAIGIATRLKLAESNIDITRRDSGARGMVFVAEHRPVLTICECAQAAGDAAIEIRGHCLGPAMEMEGAGLGPAMEGPRRGPAMEKRRRFLSPEMFMIGRC